MSKNERGFTLMELLVAMAITVLLVAALFNVFNLAGRAWQTGEARTQRYQDLRQVLDRMSDDIRSAILLSIDNNPGKEHGIKFYGCANRNSPAETGEELNFIAASHPPDGWDYGSDWTASPPKLRFDCCEISYYLAPFADGETKLNRRLQTSKLPDSSITAGGTYSPCGERIIHLNFTYYDAAGNDYDTWDSGPDGAAYCKDKLPTKVKIELTAQADLAREQKEEIFTTEVWLGQASFGDY